MKRKIRQFPDEQRSTPKCTDYILHLLMLNDDLTKTIENFNKSYRYEEKI
ncbi:hypothetical protein ND861_04705 [Leptospira sp. 2 VSF19]|uniref:Uncharacterized protein n=1 Tax=Leptospira soteropolitanensis TaxID=2950025 RepID=A0ABT3MGI7_9LEPT|nr:hypothetical protein [Leptospira soteropolitanensis]MCW7491950.1 hypothetical protein [Leptospira soteropolitanensis]MCW7525638.1 hypothetical protein [Leptospira soteropolitanensis]